MFCSYLFVTPGISIPSCLVILLSNLKQFMDDWDSHVNFSQFGNGTKFRKTLLVFGAGTRKSKNSPAVCYGTRTSKKRSGKPCIFVRKYLVAGIPAHDFGTNDCFKRFWVI